MWVAKGDSVAVVCNPHCDEVILDEGASPRARTLSYVCVKGLMYV